MNSVMVNLNSKHLWWLSDHDITIEDILVLKMIKEDSYNLLKEYLQNKSDPQKYVYFQRLVRKGMLEYLVELDEFSWDNYGISLQGGAVLAYLGESLEVKEEVTKVELTGVSEQKKSSKFEEFIKEYRDKFPEGKNGGNKSFKSNEQDVMAKMEKFIKKYKFDFETILKATDLYLSGFRLQPTGYLYCQAADYFILKDNISTLAGFCEEVKKGKTGSISNPFEQRM